MAFKKAESSESNGSIPFFAEWIKEKSKDYLEFLNGTLMEPKTVKHVASGKGYMLNFDDEFMVFLWKGSSTGNIIKRMIKEEQGYLLLLQFQQGKKSFSFDLGFDDEVEVAVIEDKFDEGVYQLEATTEKPSIAPSENRRFLTDIPLMQEKPTVKLTTTPKATNKFKTRSDGGAA